MDAGQSYVHRGRPQVDRRLKMVKVYNELGLEAIKLVRGYLLS